VKIREFFGVVPVGSLQINLPLVIEFEDNARARLEEADPDLRLVIEYSVDPVALKLEPRTGIYERHPDGDDREIPALRAPKNKNVQAIDITAGRDA
jgi:hypothetical protein